MNDTELLELIRGLVKLARPVTADEVNLPDLDVKIADTGLDSLDLIMLSVYLSELLGVPEAIAKTMDQAELSTIRQMICWLEERRTKDLPETAAEALESIK